VRRGLLFLAVVVAAACAARVAASEANAPVALTARVLRANELKDFKPAKRPVAIKDARKCAPSVYVSIIVLREHGIVACARQSLASRSLGSTGLSTVTQFKTARGAREELATEIAIVKKKGSNYVGFRVRDIPHAHGYRLSSPGSRGYNVMFSDGRFLYLVGAGFHPAAKKHLTRFDVIRAAKRLYRRVHGHPPA